MLDPSTAAAIQRLHPVAKAWLAKQLQAMLAQRGGYAMPYADNSPYGPHQEQNLNWHERAGYQRLPVGGYSTVLAPTQPMGGYASDPYGLRYQLPGSLHGHAGGYGRPVQRTVNPMRGNGGYAW